MGIFDLGDMFDFNGDGKTDADEEFMAYMMFQELQKENIEDDPDSLDDLNDFSEFGEDDFDDSKPVFTPARDHYPTFAAPSSSESVTDSDPEPDTPMPISLVDYKYLRNDFIRNSISLILLCLLVCDIPGFMMLAAVFVYDPKVRFSWYVSFLLGIGGVVLLCYIAKLFLSAVAENVAAIRECKKQYILSLSPEEKDARRLKK